MRVPKHVGSAHSMFVLIKTVSFVGIINGVYDDNLMSSRIRIHSFLAPVVVASACFTVPSH